MASKVALVSALNPPANYQYRIVFSRSKKSLDRKSIPLTQASSLLRPLSCSFSLPNPGQFQPLRDTLVSLKISSESLHKFLPKQIKEFPWKNAEYKATQRLLILGKETVRWSLALFLMISPISDVFTAISSNRELLIPVGLFIGVLVADFLKETSGELLRKGSEEWDTRTHLLGIGIIFAILKLALVFLKPPGKLLFSHLCNGGLMQVLWLLKKPGDTNDGNTESNGGGTEQGT